MATTEELYTAGQTHLREGRLDEAAQAFADTLEADHKHLRASLALARLSLGLAMVEQAAAILDRTLTFAPADAEALVLRGLTHEAAGDREAAIESFRRAAQLAPAAYEARYHHGRALGAARRYSEAIPELGAAARLQPAAAEVHYALGIAYKEAGNLGSSVSAFTRAIEANPAFLDGYVTLADVLSEAGEQEAAEKVLLQAQSLFPDVGAVYDKLAAIHLKQGKLKRVVDDLKEQVRVEPTNENAHVNLATFALAANEIEVAAGAVDRLLERDPESWRGRHLRSMLYDMSDRPDLAIADLRVATRSAPREWKPWNDLGLLLGARVRLDPEAVGEAVAALESAVRLAPAHELGPRYNLALAYWTAGRRADARERMEELVSEVPADRPLAGQAREALAAMVDAEGGARVPAGAGAPR